MPVPELGKEFDADCDTPCVSCVSRTPRRVIAANGRSSVVIEFGSTGLRPTTAGKGKAPSLR